MKRRDVDKIRDEFMYAPPGSDRISAVMSRLMPPVDAVVPEWNYVTKVPYSARTLHGVYRTFVWDGEVDAQGRRVYR